MADDDLVPAQSPDPSHDLFIGLALGHGALVLGHNPIDGGGVLHDPYPQSHDPSIPDDSHALDLVVSPVFLPRPLIAVPEHELKVGQEFPDVTSCRRALRDAAIACNFEIRTVKSDKTRFTAKCASEGCPWRIHAAKLPGVPTFSIRTIGGEHTCLGISHLGHHQASVQWVANSVEERLRENPQCKPKEILEEIHRLHGIRLSYKQAWRGKERIMAAFRESFEESFRLLPQYCEQIRKTNPGSVASVYVNPDDNRFQLLFIAYHASIYGFIHGCRPLIGLDRMPLKNKYMGTLLLASGFDGEGALFPLAFGVVDKETDKNWDWFLRELHGLLESNTENMPRLTILSDRQKGIEEAVDLNFPTAFHGLCMRHVTESFRKEFDNDMLVGLLWEAAHALTADELDAKMTEISEISPEAAYWISLTPYRRWVTAYFEGLRFGQMTANTEPMNDWIHDAAGLPIIQMMESIRRQLMTWFSERRELSAQWQSILVPQAEQRVAHALQCSQGFQIVQRSDMELRIFSPLEDASYLVDVRKRCCLCRGWQLYGLPCPHGAMALLSHGQNVHKYAENYFTVATYQKTYLQTIHPIPDKNLWKEGPGDYMNGSQLSMDVHPPMSPAPPGKLRKKRVRTEDKALAKRVVHCSRCNQAGHFRSTCVAPI